MTGVRIHVYVTHAQFKAMVKCILWQKEKYTYGEFSYGRVV